MRMEEAIVCASCPEEHQELVATHCRKFRIAKAFGKAGETMNTRSGQDWFPKWETKVVTATVVKAQEMNVKKAVLLCIQGNTDLSMIETTIHFMAPKLENVIRKEINDQDFSVRVEWLKLAQFLDRYGDSVDGNVVKVMSLDWPLTKQCRSEWGGTRTLSCDREEQKRIELCGEWVSQKGACCIYSDSSGRLCYEENLSDSQRLRGKLECVGDHWRATLYAVEAVGDDEVQEAMGDIDLSLVGGVAPSLHTRIKIAGDESDWPLVFHRTPPGRAAGRISDRSFEEKRLGDGKVASDSLDVGYILDGFDGRPDWLSGA